MPPDTRIAQRARRAGRSSRSPAPAGRRPRPPCGHRPPRLFRRRGDPPGRPPYPVGRRTAGRRTAHAVRPRPGPDPVQLPDESRPEHGHARRPARATRTPSPPCPRLSPHGRKSRAPHGRPTERGPRSPGAGRATASVRPYATAPRPRGTRLPPAHRGGAGTAEAGAPPAQFGPEPAEVGGTGCTTSRSLGRVVPAAVRPITSTRRPPRPGAGDSGAGLRVRASRRGSPSWLPTPPAWSEPADCAASTVRYLTVEGFPAVVRRPRPGSPRGPRNDRRTTRNGPLPGLSS